MDHYVGYRLLRRLRIAHEGSQLSPRSLPEGGREPRPDYLNGLAGAPQPERLSLVKKYSFQEQREGVSNALALLWAQPGFVEAINDWVKAVLRRAHINDDAIAVRKIRDDIPGGWAPLVRVGATHIDTGSAYLGQSSKAARRVGALEERCPVAVQIEGTQFRIELPPLLLLKGVDLLRGCGRIGKMLAGDLFEQLFALWAPETGTQRAPPPSVSAASASGGRACVSLSVITAPGAAGGVAPEGCSGVGGVAGAGAGFSLALGALSVCTASRRASSSAVVEGVTLLSICVALLE